MIVENETRWNTEDLRVLAEECVRQFGLNVDHELCLVFVTLRGSDRRTASTYYRYGFPGSRARIVAIKSPDSIDQRNHLERIAECESDSDAPSEALRDIAKAIYRTLTVRSYMQSDDKLDLSWVAGMKLRAIKKNMDKNVVYNTIRIDCLRKEAAYEKRKYEKKISRLTSEISRLEKRREGIRTRRKRTGQ